MSKAAIPDPRAFGSRVLEQRNAQGLNRREFGKRLGISIAYVQRIEKGTLVYIPDFLPKLAEILDTTCDWLIYGEAKPLVPYTELNAHYIRKLKELMKHLQLTQARMAADCGTSRPVFGRYLNESRAITLDILERVCAVYHVRMDYFTTDLSLKKAFVIESPKPAAPSVMPLMGTDSQAGERIRKRREQLHLTKAELGRRTGINAGNIVRLENGNTRIRYETAYKFAKALQVEPEWILYGTAQDIPYPITPDVSLFLERHEEVRRMIWEMMESDGSKAPEDD
ncbi:MAG: transcriptional regulator [Oscillospiraceae bacterium]|nr:transcriptional regulator [Oscillospiraceae bacterium]